MINPSFVPHPAKIFHSDNLYIERIRRPNVMIKLRKNVFFEHRLIIRFFNFTYIFFSNKAQHFIKIEYTKINCLMLPKNNK